MTSNGRYAVISGGPRVTSVPFVPGGMVYIIDLKKRQVVSTVTDVGNDRTAWQSSTRTTDCEWPLSGR